MIVIAGLEGVGKTSLARRYTTGEFKPSFPTLGMSTETFQSDNQSICLIDLGGHESFRQSNWHAFISVAHAMAFVVDLSNLDQVAMTRYWLWQAVSWLGSEKPILIMANKSDVAKTTSKELVKQLQIGRITKICDARIAIMDTSACTGEGVDGAFEWLIVELSRLQKQVAPIENGLLWAGLYDPKTHGFTNNIRAERDEDGNLLALTPVVPEETETIATLVGFCQDTLLGIEGSNWDLAHFKFKNFYASILFDGSQNAGAAIIGSDDADQVSLRGLLQTIVKEGSLDPVSSLFEP